MISLRRLAAFAIACLPAGAQTVQKLDPALDRIVPPEAKVERVTTGFNKWTEGPVWTRANTLLFAEIPANSIIQWKPGHEATVFMHPSGYTGTAPFAGPEPGSNGMTLDSHGRLTVAGHAHRDVWRLESLNPKAQITVLADSYQGKRLNSPNDLVYRSDGSLYFTDPPYGLETQGDKDAKKELPFSGVYRVPNAASQTAGAAPQRERLQLLTRDLPRPNGIAFSPDEKLLYVNNSEPKKIWMRYRVNGDGSLSEGQVLYDATADTSPGAPDGMKVDRDGNIFSAGPGGVWIFAPSGVHLGTIHVPERVGNVAWGEADGRTLFIAASTSIYRIRLNTAGIKP